MRGVDLATSGGHSRADVYAAQETVTEREVAKTILDDIIKLYHFLDDKLRVYIHHPYRFSTKQVGEKQTNLKCFLVILKAT